MTALPDEKCIQAARRELRVRAWDEARVEAAWRELELRRLQVHVRRDRATRVGAVALALAAAFALVIVAWHALRPPTVSLGNEAEAPASGLERLALGDGTEVRFAREARLDVRERTGARVVVAVRAGTARFRVRHDPRRIFRVEAGSVEVEDLGTAFAVENRGNSVSVAVTEGSVLVSFPDANGGRRTSATLKTGESGVYPSLAPHTAIADVARSAAEEPPVAAASGDAPKSADSQPSIDWRESARAGKHRRAYELLAPGGFRDVRDEPGDLLLASDVARLSHHPAEAPPLLRKLLAGHPRDPRAPSAAFTLGWVLMNDLGRPREAAVAFARAEALAPRGNLAEDAVARSVEAWYRAGERSRARAELERYRASYPGGRHQAMLERLLQAP